MEVSAIGKISPLESFVCSGNSKSEGVFFWFVGYLQILRLTLMGGMEQMRHAGHVYKMVLSYHVYQIQRM